MPTDLSPWPRVTGLPFGGDYNPEQWPEDVWDEDITLMVEAGVSMVTVGIFSWALIETAEGVFDFGWLDRIIGKLASAGIAVTLATPTASPPAWFSRTYPASLPVTVDGLRLAIGSRETYCPSSPDYRRASRGIATALAERYGTNPAVVLWHVNNEYGAHVQACWCPVSESAFRDWLQARYSTLDRLNAAWGTAFWGQWYGEWTDVTAPRRSTMPVNPSQQLDWARFSAAEHLACFRLERDAIRALSPQVPITTNFMSTNCPNVDYWQWADEVDLVANDHYLSGEDDHPHIGLAMAADLTRSIARGKPWMLMEHSTSAVNWQRRNIAKRPGEMQRNSVAHVARGSDSVLFFQWRASRSGAEKFHSAMLPHGGTATRLWNDVSQLGRDVAALAPVRGSIVTADVAVAWDWESRWAMDFEYQPTCDINFIERMAAFYDELWRLGLTVDFVSPTADLTSYRLVIAPSSYLLTTDAAANIERYVDGGGHLFVSFFSGIVDGTDTVHPGAYPGALRDVLGLWIDEWHPLRREETVRLNDGTVATVWSETVVPTSAEVVWTFATGPDAACPALTRNVHGRGQAWYLATKPSGLALRSMLADAAEGAGVKVGDLPAELEIVVRHGSERFVFVINHGAKEVLVPFGGTDLLTGNATTDETLVPGGGVLVLRQPLPGGSASTAP